MADQIRVKVKTSFSGPLGDFSPGQEMPIRDEVGFDPHTGQVRLLKSAAEQARRLIALGMAEPLEGCPIPAPKGVEKHPSRVEVVGPLYHDEDGVEYGTRVRPAVRPKRGDRHQIPEVRVLARQGEELDYEVATYKG